MPATNSSNNQADRYQPLPTSSHSPPHRFALEVTQAVVDAIGADRTGIRISPFQTFLDAADSTPYATHMMLVERLNPLGLAYIHMVGPRVQGLDHVDDWTDCARPFRVVSKSPFIAAGG
jgi:2,4-dienoyl-CoA reductase-like NADH-dependent reductase (Old Yellow Enzyme family)